MPLVRLSSGSGCSATCCPCGATHGSPRTGWISAAPGRQHTESGGCKRCRPRPRRSSGRGGLRWWCGWACCSWPTLKSPKEELQDTKWHQSDTLNYNLRVKPTVFKVKSVEIHPLHQVPQSFWLKWSQSRIADLPENTAEIKPNVPKPADAHSLMMGRKLTRRPQSPHYWSPLSAALWSW